MLDTRQMCRLCAARGPRTAGLSAGILCAVLGMSALYAGDFTSYRGLRFGMDLAAAAKQSGTISSEARLVHQRPALIQELDWQPRPAIRADTGKAEPLKADPVKDGELFFFNGELFRIVITYDRYKVEGMTAQDMIDGISATYGTAAQPTTEIAYHSIYGETSAVLARWEDPEYSYNLVLNGDRSSYSLVLYSKRMDALAQAAIVEAVRLEAQEAPQRNLDQQKKRDADELVSLEKARSVNKPNFHP
jgi:hypothetical protein